MLLTYWILYKSDMLLNNLVLSSNAMKKIFHYNIIYFIGVRIPVGTRDFSLLHNLEAVLGAQPAYYSKGNGALSAVAGSIADGVCN